MEIVCITCGGSKVKCLSQYVETKWKEVDTPCKTCKATGWIDVDLRTLRILKKLKEK